MIGAIILLAFLLILATIPLMIAENLLGRLLSRILKPPDRQPPRLPRKPEP